MRGALLKFQSWLIGYRFREFLGEPLKVPAYYEELKVDRIRSKAGTSLNAAGVFLAFSIAVLAAVIAAPEYRQALAGVFVEHRRVSVVDSLLVLGLLYFVIRQEKSLSMAEEKTWRYVVLFCLLGLSFFLFMIGPLNFKLENTVVGPLVARAALESAFLVSGFLSIILSALFQVFAIEFYDSASGWRGGEKEGGRALRFHLASIASHSFFFGVSFAVLGVSLLLSLIHFSAASIITLSALLVLVAVTEIERELWVRKEEDNTCRST